jgi:formate hydrogenlyase subunit 5
LARQLAIGYTESWRGEIVYWLMVDPAGQIYRCKVRDPSMLNWPALEEAVRGNYLSDFPLINKSFNLSYAGNDL